MTTWQIDGESLEAAGVVALNFSFVNQAPDVCTLTLVDRGVALRSWERKTKVTIHRNGELYFIGWVADKGSRESAGDGGLDVTLKGPWFWLEETPFGRLLQPDEGGGVSCAVQLFLQRGQTIGIREQMIEVLTWAAQASGGAFNIGQISPSAAQDRLPPEWVQAARCDDVVRRVAAWAPDSILWCSYGLQPAIHWTAPGARATHYFSKGSAPLASAQIYEDAAMAPTAVVIQYLNGQNTFAGASPISAQDAFPQGSDARTAGAAVFALDQADNKGELWAQKLYSMAARYLWSGQITLDNTRVDIRPGDLVRVSGRSEWTGCEALVQTVQVMPDTDGVVCSLGAPKHLGLDDLRELLWWMKSGGTQQVVEPTLNLHPWQVYEALNPLSIPFLKDVKMAAAVVNFGAGEIIPTWKGRPLGDESISEPLTRGYKRDFVLEIEWRPDVAKFVTYDLEGNEFQNWRAVSTGQIVSAKIVQAQRDNIAPVVNVKNGTVQLHGRFCFLIAQASEQDGELKVTQHRLTGLQTFFVPPNYLYLIE